MTRVSAVGSPDTVRRRLEEILAVTAADELMLTAPIFDHAARLRSFEIAADVRGLLSSNPQGMVQSIAV
jgi:alkanesulfonate monooxygenase SsuD/methylene tetrahydromethanopterin reductase-like flavin-dependent oxidoreductase (luciferase family)